MLSRITYRLPTFNSDDRTSMIVKNGTRAGK